MSPTPLAVYLAAQLGEAVGDMPAAAPGELFERFLAWTRHAGGR